VLGKVALDGKSRNPDSLSRHTAYPPCALGYIVSLGGMPVILVVVTCVSLEAFTGLYRSLNIRLRLAFLQAFAPHVNCLGLPIKLF